MTGNHTDFVITRSDQSSETDDRVDVSSTASDQSSETSGYIQHTDAIVDKKLKPGKLPDDSRSKDTEVTNPVDSVDELDRYSYSGMLLRAANLEDPTPIEDRSGAQEIAIERNFDARILTYALPSLADRGIPLDSEDWPIESGYVLALLLRFARGPGYRTFARHLDNTEATRKLLDLDGRSKSAFSTRHSSLSDTHLETIKAAAEQTVHAAYRAGDPFPKVVWDWYAAKEDVLPQIKPSYQEDIEAGYIPDPAFDAALDNWAEQFLDECLLPAIDFDRTDPQYPISSFIGLFAHAAIEGESLRDAAKTAGRNVGHEPVPAADTVMQPIRESSVRSIELMFQDAIAAFFDSASEYGVLEESKLLGFDLTDIPRFGSETDDPWVKGNGSKPKGKVEPAETDLKWEFGVLTFADSDLYFAIGLFLLGNDLDQADILTRTLRPAIRDISPSADKIVMDGGLYSARLIKHCRSLVGDDWMLLASSGRVPDIYENAAEGEHDFIDGKDLDILKGLDKKPNAVVVALFPWESNPDTSHLVLLTDLSEDDVDPVDLKHDYQNRCRIEFTIGTLKHKFEIPHNVDACTEIEYFTRYLSVLFYNHWVQINNCLSPRYAFPLGAKETVSANRVLHAIRDVAFEKAKRQMNTE